MHKGKRAHKAVAKSPSTIVVGGVEYVAKTAAKSTNETVDKVTKWLESCPVKLSTKSKPNGRYTHFEAGEFGSDVIIKAYVLK